MSFETENLVGKRFLLGLLRDEIIKILENNNEKTSSFDELHEGVCLYLDDHLDEQGIFEAFSKFLVFQELETSIEFKKSIRDFYFDHEETLQTHPSIEKDYRKWVTNLIFRFERRRMRWLRVIDEAETDSEDEGETDIEDESVVGYESHSF